MKAIKEAGQFVLRYSYTGIADTQLNIAAGLP